ncbi:hypothetical protein [Methanosarcina sp.]
MQIRVQFAVRVCCGQTMKLVRNTAGICDPEENQRYSFFLMAAAVEF